MRSPLKAALKAASWCFGLAALVVAAAVTGLWPKHRGPGEAIQGLYSHLNCDSQPGKVPWYEVVVTTNSLGDQSELIYFLGCR